MPAMALTTEKTVILCRETPKRSEISAKKIAEFLGVETKVVSVERVKDVESFRKTVPQCHALIAHLDTLVALADSLDAGEQGLLTLIELSSHVFVYGGESNKRHDSILKILSLGGLAGSKAVPTGGLQFRVSNDYRHLCRTFSGLTFPAADPARDSSFVEGTQPEKLEVLVRAGTQPFFVRVKHGSSQVFFTSCDELGDPNEEVSSELGLLPWFSRLAPMIIFLRSSWGNRLWHNDCPQACFIVDDPLLKQRYGFLKFSKLLETAGNQKFSACVAFIPWNYRRSSKEVVKIFSSAPDFLSLCIHGCDHTRGEFAAMDGGLLRDKAQLSLDRMKAHSDRYHIRFDDVMVFPQGMFSSEALKALENCGYLAAVNTSVRPSDKLCVLTLRDLMEVAVTRFGGVPLFARHYPKEIAEFAFDLFLGKPALMVEHHGYFRSGYGEFASFVQRMNQLDQKLEWGNLATICSRAGLERSMPNGEVHLRIYTNRFRVTNNEARLRQYVLQKPWNRRWPHPKVTLNERQWPGELVEGVLTTTFSLEPNESAEIRIALPPDQNGPTQVWSPTTVYEAKVFVRRILSEFRDNHVETNEILRRLVANVRRLWGKRKREPNSVCEYAN